MNESEPGMKWFNLTMIMALILVAGCGNPLPKNDVSDEVSEVSGKDFQPFFVYKDKGAGGNHFLPSGFMPNGKCLKVDDSWQESCYEGASCIRSVYDIACSKNDQRWSGIYWLNPANNWGKQKGGFNLQGAKKLTFWAKGDKGGERIEEFKIGGISGDFPDSDSATIGPVILTNEWRQYTIDLRGKDLSYISGGFTWSTSVDANPESCLFYLDYIQYQ